MKNTFAARSFRAHSYASRSLAGPDPYRFYGEAVRRKTCAPPAVQSVPAWPALAAEHQGHLQAMPIGPLATVDISRMVVFSQGAQQ